MILILIKGFWDTAVFCVLLVNSMVGLWRILFLSIFVYTKNYPNPAICCTVKLCHPIYICSQKHNWILVGWTQTVNYEWSISLWNKMNKTNKLFNLSPNGRYGKNSCVWKCLLNSQRLLLFKYCTTMDERCYIIHKRELILKTRKKKLSFADGFQWVKEPASIHYFIYELNTRLFTQTSITSSKQAHTTTTTPPLSFKCS